jgi:hypothetical protein
MSKPVKNNGAPQRVPRFNHYVPKFILTNFTSNGKICVFDKHSQRQFKLPPYRAMGETDFNNVELNGRVLSFEDRFTSIENKAAPVVKKIIETKSLDGLDPMESATLHIFVLNQHLRSKVWRFNQDLMINEIKRRCPEVVINARPDIIRDEELTKLSALQGTFDKLDELASILAVKHSYLMVRGCSDELYTSDSPCVMHNQRQFGPYGNIGIAVPGIEIYYPLSPDIVLAYCCPSTIKQIEGEHERSDRYIAAYFGKRFLSPAGLSSDDMAALAKMKTELQYAKIQHHHMKILRLTPTSAENVLYLNSLQLTSSHRYIAARKPNFSFAQMALRERPQWKEGRRLRVN